MPKYRGGLIAESIRVGSRLDGAGSRPQVALQELTVKLKELSR